MQRQTPMPTQMGLQMPCAFDGASTHEYADAAAHCKHNCGGEAKTSARGEAGATATADTMARARAIADNGAGAGWGGIDMSGATADAEASRGRGKQTKSSKPAPCKIKTSWRLPCLHGVGP